MAQLQRAIWLADRPSQEVCLARCSARVATDSSTQPNQEVPIQGVQTNRVTRASGLQQRFDAFVMCDFTPRSPRELPRPDWVSYQALFHLFQPHAPTEVWLMGPNSLRVTIIKWYKSHPAFAGLEASAWCKPAHDHRPAGRQQRLRVQVLLPVHTRGQPLSAGRSQPLGWPSAEGCDG